jgi:hypothetical protein
MSSTGGLEIVGDSNMEPVIWRRAKGKSGRLELEAAID